MIQININDPTDVVGNLLFASKYSLEVVKMLGSQRKRKILSERLLRACIVGDTLYKLGRKNVENNNDMENQVIATLTEYFIFNLRIIHDILTKVISTSLGKELPHSFSELLKKIKTNNKAYPEIKGDLRKHIIRYSRGFEELKGIRDSIKEDEILEVFVKDNIYCIRVKGFGKTKKERKLYEGKLQQMVFNYTAFLYILMLFISKDTKNVEGVDNLT